MRVEPTHDVQVKIVKRGDTSGKGKHGDNQHRKG